MQFTKMHGLGNDYIYLDTTKTVPENLPELAKRWSDRHCGIGADGLICVGASSSADFRMTIFNADGSQAEMCGNGIRCLAKFVYDKGMTDKKCLAIETLAGVRELQIRTVGERVSGVDVDMGIPRISTPIQIDVKGETHTLYPVCVGNPHGVIFCRNPENLDLQEIGPAVEHCGIFPDGLNAEFVEVRSPESLSMRVWERGSGETMACGTGACAALVAAADNQFCGRAATVQLPGGALNIRWDERSGHIMMSGPAVTVYEGTISADGEVG